MHLPAQLKHPAIDPAGLETARHILDIATTRHVDRAKATTGAAHEKIMEQAKSVASGLHDLGGPQAAWDAWRDYVVDASQRGVLFLDALRQRADTVIAHNAEGAPPVLDYDSELVMDGMDLPRPCNYFLLRILPPEGATIDPTKRPYVIIDPRAGHGAGIGGFKKDSQVGVAFKTGHPVYFVGFRQMPVPGQTIAMVTDAEAAFLRKIEELHPDAPKPIVVGNCQGGWATAILAATNPDLTGPIVLNGAPMSYWSGKVGQDPMRYSGGLVGGVLPAKLAGDLSGGVFDGANLVLNFEALNPGRNWFGNYFDLYQNVDKGVPRFLGFEKWWGGFYLMTTEEISWIVENLFVGNRLSKNMAQLEPGRSIDLKRITAPIICFASYGDNITPPGQALNWIVDTYSSETEIEILGQRILYMLHDQVGHLGIFVSSSIANKEYSQLTGTVANIEALPPGLYEMVIEGHKGEGDDKSFVLAVKRRNFDDLLEATGDRSEEAAFAAVARGSEALDEAYDATIRPFVVQEANEQLGQIQRDLHPMRITREMFSSSSPGMSAVASAADQVREDRNPVGMSNPFRQVEYLWSDIIQAGWDSFRDMREAAIEMSFLGLYLNPFMMAYGEGRNHERAQIDPSLLSDLPAVRHKLRLIRTGGLAEGMIRMLILIAATRMEVRSDRLGRALEVFHSIEPIKSISPQDRVRIVHEQTVICHFSPKEALATLPVLLKSETDRKTAMDTARFVVGSVDEMAPDTRKLMEHLHDMLEQGGDGTASAAE